MVPFELPDHKRAAYHASASVASNFLVTLQAMAEEVARDAGLELQSAGTVKRLLEEAASLGFADPSELRGHACDGDFGLLPPTLATEKTPAFQAN
jgi:predicted short-subunit dehydrogenase-like oxidoreductase (DUF2520 family)